MSEITKEEVQALVESNTKVSGALQLIVERLETCSDNMAKILDILSSRQKQFDVIDEMKPVIIDIKADTFWVKMIFGSISFITTIVLAIQAAIHFLISP